LPLAVTRLATERMVTNSSAADGCIPTCGTKKKKKKEKNSSVIHNPK